MDPLYARYPFLEEARAAVEAADIDLLDVVDTEGSPIVERAVERIDGSIRDGRVPDPIRDNRIELLSYPIARVLASLVDDPALTERYALAEARRAFSLYAADREADVGLRSSRGNRLTRDRLLADFGLEDDVVVDEDRCAVSVTPYLSLASELRQGDWRLVNRSLSGGRVPVTRVELDELIREAIRRRVGEDLPLDVPDVIAEGVAAEVERIESTLAEVPVPDGIDRVVPAAFPPCIAPAIDRLRAGEASSELARFAAVSFLGAIGMTADEVIAYIEPDDSEVEATIRRMVARVHGGTSSTAYPPPGCSTMDASGACVDHPDRCDDVGHPLAAYAIRMREYPEDADWRAPESA